MLLESGALRQSFPVAIGMSGWETPTGRFKVLQKIDKSVMVHPVSGDRIADQSLSLIHISEPTRLLSIWYYGIWL